MAKIYQVTNTINGKVYIGKTQGTLEKRWKEHISDSHRSRCEKRPLYNAIRKYGSDAFTIKELETCSTDEACERERYWIEKTGSFRSGYNATTGGDGKPYVDGDLLYSLWRKGYNITEIHKKTSHDKGSISKYLRDFGVLPSEIKLRAAQALRNMTPVYKYATSGKFIEAFPCVRDATTNIISNNLSSAKRNTVATHIKQVCAGERHSAYGYVWSYTPPPL